MVAPRRVAATLWVVGTVTPSVTAARCEECLCVTHGARAPALPVPFALLLAQRRSTRVLASASTSRRETWETSTAQSAQSHFVCRASVS